MQISLILAQQIAELFLILLIGCVLVKARLLKSADSRVLSVVMVYAVMPCVIINAFQVDYSPAVVTGLLYAFALAIALHALLLLLARLLRRPLRLDVIESVQTQVQTRPVLTLPQSLHGAHTAYCYVAVGGSSLPDIDGELLAQENGVSWFRLDNSMETLEKTLQTVEQAGCTVTAYDKVDLTIDSHADSWILAVVTG